MLMAMINEPDNHQLLERDLKYAFWQNHAIVDAAIGTFIEYGTTNRDKNKEMLCRTLASLDLSRITIAPTCCRSRNTASKSTTMTSPRHGTVSSRRTTSTRPRSSSRMGWSVNFWRIEAQTEKDFEWFEHKYPGWYAEFGDYWKWHAKLSVPGENNILFNAT